MGEIFLCTEPPKMGHGGSVPMEDGIICELQEGMHMNGKPVYACTVQQSVSKETLSSKAVSRFGGGVHMTQGAPKRVADVDMMADGQRPTTADVSDLGLSMDELEEALPEDFFGAFETSGYESTSRTTPDQGVEWEETADFVNVVVTIPGLRGQPAMALSVDFDSETMTVTGFGRQVFSCVMRGQVEVDQCGFEVVEGTGAAMGVPVIRLTVRKQPNQPRWKGFIKEIGEDSLWQ